MRVYRILKLIFHVSKTAIIVFHSQCSCLLSTVLRWLETNALCVLCTVYICGEAPSMQMSTSRPLITSVGVSRIHTHTHTHTASYWVVYESPYIFLSSRCFLAQQYYLGLGHIRRRYLLCPCVPRNLVKMNFSTEADSQTFQAHTHLHVAYMHVAHVCQYVEGRIAAYVEKEKFPTVGGCPSGCKKL